MITSAAVAHPSSFVVHSSFLLWEFRDLSSSGSLAETSLPSIFILSLALCFHVAKVRIYFGPCKQNAKKPVFFGGIFHPIFARKYPLKHILSFLTPPSTAPGRSVQENFPHGAGKFLAPRAGALSYIHHFMLFYIMPSAGAPPSTSRQSLPTKSTFKL